jgi:hypothetical protein
MKEWRIGLLGGTEACAGGARAFKERERSFVHALSGNHGECYTRTLRLIQFSGCFEKKIYYNKNAPIKDTEPSPLRDSFSVRQQGGLPVTAANPYLKIQRSVT